jgi:Tol biopolymer transport system component/tRNA A-37 threonylcarbamoyl transferase component Bud32
MAILPGRRLGPHEILSAIGAGGMGEVYKARDTRLDRIVAIKVLPAHLADRSELRERFEREARTIASLNHPHICTLHDIGQQDGTDFLVMEYLEGETLAQRLLKGSLPIDLVLQYAIEISDALDKAHRKGVTHRDLKPGNIMLTKSGTKLLDFGLAKLKQEATPANVPLSELPTANDALTAQGTIVGTLQYMAPEQLEGKEVDARTDIFAFGTVVYEMATGKRAFEGKSQASLIAAILEREPPTMSSLQPMTPPALDRTIRTCLAKDVDSRWQSASDLEREFKWISESGSQVALAPAAAVKGLRTLSRRGMIIIVGVVLLASAIGSLATLNLRQAVAPTLLPVTRTVINLSAGQQLAGLDNGPAIALSPDGSHLVYVARQGGVQQIYLHAMDSLESNPIPGTEGASNPFFSPDGQWLGFFAGGKLMKVSASGGAAIALGEASLPVGASWGNQGTIAFAPSSVAPIQLVPDAGGAAQVLTHLEKGENSNRWPEFLPSNRALLFVAGTAAANWINSRVVVRSAATGEQRNLIQGATHPHYALSGHLVYAQGVSLVAVPFDPQRLAVTGTGVPVVQGVLQSPISGAAQYSFSSTGSLVYVPGSVQSAQSRLVWVRRDGTEQLLGAPAHAYFNPRVSPNGREVAVTVTDKEAQIWLYDLLRETLTRLTFVGNVNNAPVWTPDGKRIAFNSNSNTKGTLNIFWQLADGSGGIEQLTTSEFIQAPVSFSRDGQLLCFLEINPATGFDIWILQVRDHKAQPFLRTPFNESAPQLSPDGRWLAYISTESGRYEIYVQPYPGPGGKWQISTEGGTEPVWNPNGRELFYRSGSKMMAVDILTQPSFVAGRPRMLFEGPYLPTPLTNPNYDVSPDGQRFLMLKPSESAEAAPTQINVVLNWFEELKRHVPAGIK